MSYPALRKVSVDEYLLMERNSPLRHEYFNGEVVAMAGNTEAHNLIVGNLIGEMHSFLKGKQCKVFPSDFRVSTPLFESYMYPDVTVVCGDTELKDSHFDTLLNPSVVIEVMSRTTEQNDRGYKYFYYQKIPSLKEYILIDSTRCRAEVIALDENRSWKIYEVEGRDGVLPINSIGLKLAMSDVYDRVVGL